MIGRTPFLNLGAPMNAQFTEAFKSVGLLGVVVRPVIVAMILVGLWRALQRANVSPRARVAAWWWTAVPLVGWLGTV